MKASPDVVTSTLSIFSHNVYALIDPSFTLSYITPLVVGKFKRAPKLLNKPFEMSTSIGESIMDRRVYCDCVVTACDRDTLADLIELEIVEFDVIIGMDRTKRVYFTFLMRQFLNGMAILGH